MTRAFTRLAYTPSVRAAQQRNGAREHSERMAQRPPERDALPEEMQARIANANSVVIGTASLEGWPHVQHRGGPRGFIKVLGPRALAFAGHDAGVGSGAPRLTRTAALSWRPAPVPQDRTSCKVSR